jgi:hypothetical protein
METVEFSEDPQYPNMHNTGLELQVIDDNIYQGAKENMHRASDFFGIANARIRESNPVGAWNQVHITVKNNKLTVLHNGASWCKNTIFWSKIGKRK